MLSGTRIITFVTSQLIISIFTHNTQIFKMQFSTVLFTLAAVSAVQAANNSTSSTTVSTAGAPVNAYGSVALGAVAAAAVALL
ncbi:hypothetical protein C6P42_004592 [Pichia californica]|nr:hypothetical protein C6P42_004592 [[Candida] californica]